jgi:hypothetical protein
MQVYVVDTLSGLSGKTRRVEVVDVRHFSVKDIEHFEHDTCLIRKSISRFPIPQRRAPGLNAGVFDERARTEMANAKAAENRVLPFSGKSR